MIVYLRVPDLVINPQLSSLSIAVRICISESPVSSNQRCPLLVTNCPRSMIKTLPLLGPVICLQNEMQMPAVRSSYPDTAPNRGSCGTS